MSYQSNGVTVDQDYVPSNVMECQTLLKIHNESLRPKNYDLTKYRCDICRKYFAPTKHFVETHKATEHKIPMPKEPVQVKSVRSKHYPNSKVVW